MTLINTVKFWQRFSRIAEILRQKILSDELRFAFYEVEKVLQECEYHFAFELTHDGHNAILILTPEGDQTIAAQIDSLLAGKPAIDSWIIYGRRQKKTIKDAFTFIHHIYGIDISDCKFSMTESIEGLKINLASRSIEGLSGEERQGLVATLLDHLVGEEVMMTKNAIITTNPKYDEGQLYY